MTYFPFAKGGRFSGSMLNFVCVTIKKNNHGSFQLMSRCRSRSVPEKKMVFETSDPVEVEQLFFLKNDAWKRIASFGTSLGGQLCHITFLGGVVLLKPKVDFCVTNPWDLESFFFPLKFPSHKGGLVFSWFVTVKDFHPNIKFFASDFVGDPSQKFKDERKNTMNVKKFRVWVLKTLGLQLFQKPNRKAQTRFSCQIG